MTPRADVALPCVLRRQTGAAIDARTVNLEVLPEPARERLRALASGQPLN